MHKTLYNISLRGSVFKTLNFFEGVPVLVEGSVCAMTQWHNGQSKPGFDAS